MDKILETSYNELYKLVIWKYLINIDIKRSSKGGRKFCCENKLNI